MKKTKDGYEYTTFEESGEFPKYDEIKTGKGWYQLIKDNEIPEHTGELTLENVTSIMNRMFEQTAEINKRKVVIQQRCLTNGIVNRDGFNLNICSNPDCYGCSMLNKMIAEELKQFKTK
jgi:hypothetical protein